MAAGTGFLGGVVGGSGLVSIISTGQQLIHVQHSAIYFYSHFFLDTEFIEILCTHRWEWLQIIRKCLLSVWVVLWLYLHYNKIT